MLRARRQIADESPSAFWRPDISLDVLNEMLVGATVAAAPLGKFLWHNKVADRILRAASELAPSETFRAPRGVHADGRLFEIHEYPLSRALTNGEVVKQELVYYNGPGGRRLILEVSATPVSVVPDQRLAVCTYQEVTAEHEAREQLKQASERIKLALDAGSIVGTFVWDVRNDVVTADELYARSFGLDPEHCRRGLGREIWLAMVHPADIAGVNAAFAEALARDGKYRHQHRMLQGDGRYRWVETTGRIEVDQDGAPVRFAGVLVDITVSKQAEEARDLLMREVDHRARNALAMVQSVVRLTEASDPDHYREEIIGRVDAMARAQGSLTRSNWQGSLVEDLIHDELGAYATPARFSLAGPKIKISTDQVQPLNMIVHELATNAIKYGALSARTGRVEVAWRVTPEGEIELTWREHGGPPVVPPSRTGFGTRLINSLARQLAGTIERDWLPGGLQLRLAWRL